MGLPKLNDQKARDPIQAKRERAIGYLRERGIYRGDLNCKHVYINAAGNATRPGAPFTRKELP